MFLWDYIYPEKKFEKHGIWISKKKNIYITNNLLIYAYISVLKNFRDN